MGKNKPKIGVKPSKIVPKKRVKSKILGRVSVDEARALKIKNNTKSLPSLFILQSTTTLALKNLTFHNLPFLGVNFTYKSLQNFQDSTYNSHVLAQLFLGSTISRLGTAVPW